MFEYSMLYHTPVGHTIQPNYMLHHGHNQLVKKSSSAHRMILHGYEVLCLDHTMHSNNHGDKWLSQVGHLPRMICRDHTVLC
jgi:hypothetical protein